jgi:hypothetical protein
MFNVYKNQLSLQTGSRNLTGPKTRKEDSSTPRHFGTVEKKSVPDAAMILGLFSQK